MRGAIVKQRGSSKNHILTHSKHVGRIRALIKKAPARKDAVEINDAILNSRDCDFRFVPILLQKSAYRRRGTAGAFFETIDCHPLDCAGDLRSTLLTLATLTQRTKGRTVVAGRPTWQAYGGSAQSLPT